MNELTNIKKDGIANIIQGNHIEINSIDFNNMINELRALENKPIRQHKTFLRNIRKYVDSLTQLGMIGGYKFVLANYLDEQGKERPMYIFDKKAILFVAGKESDLVQSKIIEYVTQADDYIKEIGQREEFKYYRETGKIPRLGFTDAVHDNIGNDKIDYKNYTELAYIIAFGKNTKKLKVERGLRHKDNLRDHLTVDELKDIAEVEEVLKTIIKHTNLDNLTREQKLDKILDKIKQLSE